MKKSCSSERLTCWRVSGFTYTSFCPWRKSKKKGRREKKSSSGKWPSSEFRLEDTVLQMEMNTRLRERVERNTVQHSLSPFYLLHLLLIIMLLLWNLKQQWLQNPTYLRSSQFNTHSPFYPPISHNKSTKVTSIWSATYITVSMKDVYEEKHRRERKSGSFRTVVSLRHKPPCLSADQP